MRLSPLIAAFLCALVLPSAAQQTPAPAAPTAEEVVAAAAPATPAGRALTADDLEIWLDGFMPYALDRGDLAGAVVVVVKDGQVLFQRGYGYADIESERRIDPETTMFRPGSVSKLFTWTAVMQMVEQGKIDLDADINTYLDFEIPPYRGQPITMRNLMTHTGGFEEIMKNVIIETPHDWTLAERMGPPHLPARVFAPGATPSYSNYGTSLAGYIVERVSGEPYADYIQRHILDPLGMQHSSMHQPLPENLQPFMASGYARASAGRPGFFEIVDIAPAGGLSASGADMARFMIAHLQNGALGENRILRTETAEQMHTTEYEGVPNLNHMVLGFYQRDINGRRAISHGGDTYFFHSDLTLFLDDNVGLFISMNSTGTGGATGALRQALFEQFADRYLPNIAPPDGEVDEAMAREHARMMAGSYEAARRIETSFAAAGDAFSRGTRIEATPDGSIRMIGGMGGGNAAPARWKEIAPFVWREVGGHNRLAAQVENGRVVRFAIDQQPFVVFDRAPVWKSSGLMTPIMQATAGIIALTALFWPVIALVRRRYNVNFPHAGAVARSYRVVRIAAWVALAGILGWFLTIQAVSGGGQGSVDGRSDWLVLAMSIAALFLFGIPVLIGLWNAYVVWTNRTSWWSKVWATLLAIAFIVLFTFAWTFNLIGFTSFY